MFRIGFPLMVSKLGFVERNGSLRGYTQERRLLVRWKIESLLE